jgi:dTMP kinase
MPNIRSAENLSFLNLESKLFITFEGIEGCGKTTQIKRLAKTLESYGIPCVSTLEPGGTGIGQDIRRVLLDSKNSHLSALAELILYAADRAQHIEEIIMPALDQGRWVICDRFFDATVAYQGAGRGIDMDFIKTLNDKVTKGTRPDITLLLDCPAEIGIKRALSRNNITQDGQDRFEREKIEFHKKVRDCYLALSRHEKRFSVIDATLSEDAVEQQILKVIVPHIEGWKK